MKDVFTRLLKVLWFFNLVFGIGVILSMVLMLLSGASFSQMSDLLMGLGIFICSVPTLIIMQYVLTGSFNPMRLFKRERVFT